MNRLLLIPFVVVCAGFGALVYVNSDATSSTIESITSPAATDAAVTTRLLDAATVEDMILDRWDELTPSQFSFSRVMRPGKRYNRPEVFVDTDCPVTDDAFVGSIRLQLADVDAENEGSHRTFPVVVDRITGQSVVYSENRWVSFDSWAMGPPL